VWEHGIDSERGVPLWSARAKENTMSKRTIRTEIRTALQGAALILRESQKDSL